MDESGDPSPVILDFYFQARCVDNVLDVYFVGSVSTDCEACSFSHTDSTVQILNCNPLLYQITHQSNCLGVTITISEV